MTNCRICQHGKIFIRNRDNNTIQESHCPKCNGSGEMSNYVIWGDL